MIKKEIENEKFILYFQYNEELEKFENIKYTEKNLNELEKKILKEVLLLFTKCSIQELYEHLIIRVENKLRNFNNVAYQGVLFPENISIEYKYFQEFFRKLLKPYIKKDLKKTINFQAIKPNKDWISLNDDQKIAKIYDQLKKYNNLQYTLGEELKIIRFENKVDIFIELPQFTDIDSKNKFCLDLEIYLKKNLDESLNIYLETVADINKIRRLSL